MNRREESLKRIDQEIAREKAEALGRAGERLERLLAELTALAAELSRLGGSAAPEALAEAERRYERLRGKVLEARRWLMIQREAVGFRRHHLVADLFPVPPPRRRRSSSHASE